MKLLGLHSEWAIFKDMLSKPYAVGDIARVPKK